MAADDRERRQLKAVKECGRRRGGKEKREEGGGMCYDEAGEAAMMNREEVGWEGRYGLLMMYEYGRYSHRGWADEQEQQR